MKPTNRYTRIIERIFFDHYIEGAVEVRFDRQDITRVAAEMKIDLPKNLGDIVYTFRYRGQLPESVRARAPQGREWIIRPAGRAQYCFVASATTLIVPSEILAETKVPDATPGIIGMYALNDEQALLAKLRYNRLIDVFTGVTCYSLQSHLRTTAPGVGQIETDEIYVGIDRRGVHYVIPVQAKGGRDALSIVQIEQDFALCASKFPGLVCRPVAAQFMDNDSIALFVFEDSANGVVVSAEQHYRLVLPEELSPDDLALYRSRGL